MSAWGLRIDWNPRADFEIEQDDETHPPVLSHPRWNDSGCGDASPFQARSDAGQPCGTSAARGIDGGQPSDPDRRTAFHRRIWNPGAEPARGFPRRARAIAERVDRSEERRGGKERRD